MNVTNKLVRCVIYTRNATAEGMDAGGSCLRLQKEKALECINQHVNDGWVYMQNEYHDVASGLTKERPALKRLLGDIVNKNIDCVVVFDIARLTRSDGDWRDLLDFFSEHSTILAVVMPHTTDSPLVEYLRGCVERFKLRRENESSPNLSESGDR